VYKCHACDEFYQDIQAHRCNASALALAGGNARATCGTIWKNASKLWIVKATSISVARSYSRLVEIGGREERMMATDMTSHPLEPTWTLFATDMAALEKLRAESDESMRANPPKFKVTHVDGKRVPQVGDVWRWTCSEGESCEWTLSWFHASKMSWFATSADVTSPVPILFRQSSPGWTFVRSAEEKPFERGDEHSTAARRHQPRRTGISPMPQMRRARLRHPRNVDASRDGDARRLSVRPL
jgi:hypothetical protein